MTTTVVRYHPLDEPVPPGWIESTPAADMGHHGEHSRLIRLVDAEADRDGQRLAAVEPASRQASLVGWPSPEEFWP